MISLSTITSYTGANGVLLNAQQTGLESAGFVHRLKSFFGIGDAREKNRATLNALKDAILTDPRFSTQDDLKAEVERLFKQERTYLAVDMSRIRGIMQRVGKLADGSGAMLDRRVDLHLAAVLPPPGVNTPPERAMLVAYADLDDIALIAKQHVRNAAAGGSVVDVATLVGEVLGRCATAITRVAPLTRRPEPEDMEYAGHHLQLLLMQPDRTLRTDGEVAEYVSGAFGFARGAQEAAALQAECRLDPSRAEREADARYIKQCKMAALEFACSVGGSAAVRIFGFVPDYMARLPLDTFGFGSFKRNSSAADVRAAIQNLASYMVAHPLGGVNGASPFDNLKATKALARYLATLVAVLRLPDSICDKICNKLHCSTVAEAMENEIHSSILRWCLDAPADRH